MELDLQSLFGLHVHSCAYWLRPRTHPLRIWAHIRLVSQDRRHLFVTPWVAALIRSVQNLSVRSYPDPDPDLE